METLFYLYIILSPIMARTAGSRNFTPEITDLVMRKHRAGEKLTQIAHSLCMSRASVHAIVKRGGVATPKTGRTPTIDPRMRRRVVRLTRTNRGIYSTEIVRELGLEVTPQTVRENLRKAGIKNRVAQRKPTLTKAHRLARLEFAKKHAQKPLSFWHSVLWSDESKIVSVPNPRRRVWRPDGEALNPKYISGTQKSGRTNIMVWGCCSAAGVGNLHYVDTRMNAEVYTQVLRENLESSRRALDLPENWVFMHDNDPKHKARKTTEWLENQGVETLKWPANSPDLNPIEHLWDHLKREFPGSTSRNEEVLFARVRETWQQISPQIVRNLVDSMPRRLEAVIKAKGGNTKY